MKTKLGAAILAFFLLMSLAACSPTDDTSQNNADIVGTWELEAVKLDGKTHVDSEYLDCYDYSFVFTQDGQVTARILGVSYSTTYEIRDGWILFADAALGAVKLQVAGNKLEMELNALGGGLIFTRRS